VQRRRSRHRSHQIHNHSSSAPRVLSGPASAHGSSQDEYEESESESDQVLSSSNEDVAQLVGDGEDDNLTTLGARPAENMVFTPQPNAFSHPPLTRANRASSSEDPVGVSYPPLPPGEGLELGSAENLSIRTITQRGSYPQRSSLPQPFPNDRLMSLESGDKRSKSLPDHDAALRASLTTLLSCAAAVRGSPKQRDTSLTSGAHRQERIEPRSLRLISESQLLEEEPVTTSHRSARQTSAKPSSSPSKIPAAAKRKSREASKERHTKKARNATSKAATTEEELALYSTLTSWMISAGVVLVFSAISFSAGYAWGREVGRIEGEMGLSTRSCGQEVMRSGGGLRRLKWSTASSSLRA
jgi:hypothetical protein